MIYSEEAMEQAASDIISRYSEEYHRLAGEYEREIRIHGGISQ